MTKFKQLPKPLDEEEDVLYELGRLYRENQTRMACQLKLTPEMNDSEIEIPRSAFAFFEKFNDDDDR